jgi:tetratricopeptide (TPR) repeat protein
MSTLGSCRPLRPGRSGPGLLAALAWAALALLAACQRPPPPPRQPTPVEERLAAWRADPAPPRGTADQLVARGGAALAAGTPASIAEAAAAFRAALVADPARLDAVAGLATAFADTDGEEPDGGGLKEAHAVLAWALAQAPERADLLAAQARLLALVPSARNQAEALEASRRAAAQPESGPGAALARGLALLPGDPTAAADGLETAAIRWTGDRRLVAAAARARWAQGDAAAALRLAEHRLSLDGGLPAMVELAAEIEADSGRAAAAVRRLERWRAGDPASPRPPFLLGRLTAQALGDPVAAAARLDEALTRRPGDVLLARIEAQRAAVALWRGDVAAAERSVAAALARVPASAPAQYQAARQAFRRQDRAALLTAAGVVGERCGRSAALRLAARQAELGSASLEDAERAWTAWAADRPRDPAVALLAGGALARIGLSGPAIRVARLALSLDPVEGRLRGRIGDCWEGPGELAEVAARFEAVATAEGRAGREARLLAALAWLGAGRAPQAARLALLVSREWPQDATARLLAAQAALDAERVGQARALAEGGAEQDPPPALRSLQARLAQRAARPDPAPFAPLLGPQPSGWMAAAALGRARALAALGRKEEARQVAADLLAVDPEVGAARGLLLDLAVQRPPQPPPPPPGVGSAPALGRPP